MILGVAIFASIAELVYYVESANRELSLFLLSIKSSDFSKLGVKDKRGRSFAELKKAFNIIMEEFQQVRIEREENYVYLQAIVGHLNTAIISFDKNGSIKLMNEAAKVLLNVPFAKNILTLKSIDPKLYDTLSNIQQGKSTVLETMILGEALQLSMRSTIFSIQGVEHKLVSIHNIKTEIENTELEAWEQLLQVLTHEIMNSITPISSLSSTLKKKTDESLSHKSMDTDTMDDLAQGLRVIEKRSLGLMNFVHDYRSLTHLPSPVFKIISVNDLFTRIQTLKQKELQEKGIELNIRSEYTPTNITADPGLIEQVLINLVNNAEHALQNTQAPMIDLSVTTLNDKTIITVKDNGAGMDKGAQSKIFIPFFTTKQNGSGVGLSLSKQIMRMHNGSIDVLSTPGGGSAFSLVFHNSISS